MGLELKQLVNAERSRLPFTIGQIIGIGQPTVLDPQGNCLESGNPQGSFIEHTGSFSFTVTPAEG